MKKGPNTNDGISRECLDDDTPFIGIGGNGAVFASLGVAGIGPHIVGFVRTNVGQSALNVGTRRLIAHGEVGQGRLRMLATIAETFLDDLARSAVEDTGRRLERIDGSTAERHGRKGGQRSGRNVDQQRRTIPENIVRHSGGTHHVSAAGTQVGQSNGKAIGGCRSRGKDHAGKSDLQAEVVIGNFLVEESDKAQRIAAIVEQPGPELKSGHTLLIGSDLRESGTFDKSGGKTEHLAALGDRTTESIRAVIVLLARLQPVKRLTERTVDNGFIERQRDGIGHGARGGIEETAPLHTAPFGILNGAMQDGRITGNLGGLVGKHHRRTPQTLRIVGAGTLQDNEQQGQTII